MERGGRRQRRRRIKLQIVGARICAGGRWHHFCLSRGHGFRCPRGASWDGPWRLTASRSGLGQSASDPLTSSRFTALPCDGEIFAAAASLLPIPARDGQRTNSREHHVTVGSRQPVNAEGHCVCRWQYVRTSTQRGCLAKAVP
jgi:hypothetical protein